MNAQDLILLQKFAFFRFSHVLLPMSISSRYVREDKELVYRWKELRIFGVLIAMWGTIG